jgi:hypothetical protein
MVQQLFSNQLIYFFFCFSLLALCYKNRENPLVNRFLHFLKNKMLLVSFYDMFFQDLTDCLPEEDSTKQLQVDPPLKYEDKYLADIKKMSLEYIFNEEEQEQERIQFNTLLQSRTIQWEQSKQELQTKIRKIECEIQEEKMDDINDDDDSEKNIYLNELLNEKQTVEKQLYPLEDQNGINEEEIQLEARNYIIKKRLEKLKNCYIFEKTPLGNVAMYYNCEREGFEFYSDNTIPYRFLEVIARKYVKTFDCRPIFVDMEEELKKYKQKMEEREKQIEEQKQQLLLQSMDSTNTNALPKKSVFAKFKSYNKEAGSGRVNSAPPPKNSIPNSKINTNAVDDKIILKESSNRYTYQGRFSNFKPMQKIERKKVDKKYAMNFAEFKKMQLQTK